MANLAGTTLLALLVAIRLAKPIKIFMFPVDRIGHTATCIDQFLRRFELGIMKKDNTLYVGFVTTRPVNEQFLRMYKREMKNRGFFVFDVVLLRRMDRTFFHYVVTSIVVRKSAFYQKLPGTDRSNELHEFDKTRQILSFTPAEEETGKAILKKMGIGEEDWYICFHSRDSKYLGAVYQKINLDYHNYRDCNVENYMSAAEYITSRGGAAVRVGHVVAKRLPVPHNSKIIDYSLHYRTDFGDVYLPAKCKFFLANTTGLFLVSTVFGVPVALANFIPLEYIFWMRRGDLFIPKKIKSIKEKRLLTFREMLELGTGRYLESEKFQKAGLEVIENTAEEILDLTREMNERIDGTWMVKDGDEELHIRFRSIFKPNHLCYGFSGQIGTAFLRKNKFLLE
jgi:putative glycosyltransferase (TIGR04372 family)